jgi:cytochrome c biogenesis protein CcmG/thiol:disulfide interchange protein DsbE
MPQTRVSWLILTAVVAVLGAAWIGMTRVQASAPVAAGAPSAQVGSEAPDFALQTVDGGTLALSDLHGTPVVVNFWATWCPPCRAEIPALEAAHRDLGGEVVVLGVDVGEGAGVVGDFVDEVGVTYPVALDADQGVARTYRVRAFPTTYFIDARGVIVDVHAGPLNEPLLYTKLTELVGR